MNRTSTWLVALVCVGLFAFAFLGVTNAQHVSAKIVYAIVIALTSAGLSRLAPRRS